MIFSFVYTAFALFRFHVLVAYDGPEGLYLIFFFRKRFRYQNRLFLPLKLGVISIAKQHTFKAQIKNGQNRYKSYFARHFYAVLKLWVTDKCSLLLRRERLVMNRKGPWEGYSCLLPAFLCAHILIERETSGYEAVINACATSSQ